MWIVQIPCTLHNYSHSRQKSAILSGKYQEEGDFIWRDRVLSGLDDCPLTTFCKSLNQARVAVIAGSLGRIRECDVDVGSCLVMIVDLTWGLRDGSHVNLLSCVFFKDVWLFFFLSAWAWLGRFLEDKMPGLIFSNPNSRPLFIYFYASLQKY